MNEELKKIIEQSILQTLVVENRQSLSFTIKEIEKKMRENNLKVVK